MIRLSYVAFGIILTVAVLVGYAFGRIDGADATRCAPWGKTTVCVTTHEDGSTIAEEAP